MAQTIETLNEIEVSTEKIVSPYHFGSSHLITAEEFNQAALPSVSNVIERASGIVSTQNGGPGGRTSFFIRGTEARHISFTLDGLKLNDPSNTDRQFDASFFNLPSISHIQIYKGPQAVLFGSDSLGGHIAMISKKGSAHNAGRVSFQAGSFNTRGMTVADDWNIKKHQGTVTLNRVHSAGISRLSKKRFGAKEKDESISTQVTSSSNHKLSPKLQTDLLGVMVRGENELDGALTDNKTDRSLNDQILLQQKTTYELIKKSKLSLRNGLNRHVRNLKTEAVGNEFYAGSIAQNEVLLETENDLHLFTLGGVHERESFNTSGLDKNFDLNSIFIQSLLRFNSLEFQAGLRSENHSRYGKFLTGSTGLKYKNDHIEAAYQYSRGFKAPSLYQLYAEPLFGFPVGNQNLKPETNKAHEISLKITSQMVDLSVTGFQNNLSNLITFTNAGYRNQGSFKTQGVEAGIKLKMNSLVWHNSLTHQRFSDEQTRVLRRPLNLGQSSLSYFLKESTELFILARFFSSRADLDPLGNEVKLNPFQVFDLGVHHKWSNQDLTIRLVNIFDREYEELYGYSVMPLSIFGSYGINF